MRFKTPFYDGARTDHDIRFDNGSGQDRDIRTDEDVILNQDIVRDFRRTYVLSWHILIRITDDASARADRDVVADTHIALDHVHVTKGTEVRVSTERHASVFIANVAAMAQC